MVESVTTRRYPPSPCPTAQSQQQSPDQLAISVPLHTQPRDLGIPQEALALTSLPVLTVSGRGRRIGGFDRDMHDVDGIALVARRQVRRHRQRADQDQGC